MLQKTARKNCNSVKHIQPSSASNVRQDKVTGLISELKWYDIRMIFV